MVNTGAQRRFLGNRLARHLFALFVLAAMLPLALSGWFSNSAVSQIATNLSLRNSTQATRHTSREVFDRLLAGKTLLAAAPLAAPAPGSAAAAPGLGRVFRSLSLLQPDGAPAWSSDPMSDLARAWAEAQEAAVTAAPTRESARSLTASAAASHVAPTFAPTHAATIPLPLATLQIGGVEVHLRTHTPAGQPPRQLLGASHQGVLRWLAELDPAYLWAPVHDGETDLAWQVTDTYGRMLLHTRGADFEGGDFGRPLDAESVENRATLFLGGEFGAADWVFVQRGHRPQVRWHGTPLTVWLGLVALATLLAIALLSQWQIRRTLVPLERLADGARRLAAGAAGTRVAVRRNDEIGALAGAFNDMAANVEAQFSALQGLAAIDQAILGGASVRRLAERVLQQLALLYPGAGAVVSWSEGAAGLQVAQIAADGGTLHQQAVTLSPQQAETYRAMGGDMVQPVEPAGNPVAAPWLPTVWPDDTTQRVLLPLGEPGQTQALIVLHLPAAAPGLQPARELRDRLAVALAARARERELVHRAAHDSLTGLANRHGLHTRLDSLLGGRSAAAPLAVLFLDLDHFKDVNDSRGHPAGDELLCLAAARLRAGAPEGALVARHGGDEFAVLLPNADEAAACTVAADFVERLGRPFALRGGEHVLGASVGVALAPAHGHSREELLRCADIALYAAKAAGRGRCTVFSAALDAAARERVQLQAELRRALERAEFRVHYQPRVQPHHGGITSAEALIRWLHPERGLLLPGAFIEQAEASGLIDGIGAWVLDAACAQMAAWRRRGVALERVSVNVSARQLDSGDLLRLVRGALDRHELPGDALELEVTESLLVGDATAACAQLSELRRWGVSVALDDFGTGYSSMSVLRQLPIDVMKIDRSFVTDLGQDHGGHDEGAMAVTRAIVTLARSMRLRLVAEGIENEAQAGVLRALGCDELQGYLYSKAVAPEQFVRLPGLRSEPACSAV